MWALGDVIDAKLEDRDLPETVVEVGKATLTESPTEYPCSSAVFRVTVPAVEDLERTFLTTDISTSISSPAAKPPSTCVVSVTILSSNTLFVILDISVVCTSMTSPIENPWPEIVVKVTSFSESDFKTSSVSVGSTTSMSRPGKRK